LIADQKMMHFFRVTLDIDNFGVFLEHLGPLDRVAVNQAVDKGIEIDVADVHSDEDVLFICVVR